MFRKCKTQTNRRGERESNESNLLLLRKKWRNRQKMSRTVAQILQGGGNCHPPPYAATRHRSLCLQIAVSSHHVKMQKFSPFYLTRFVKLHFSCCLPSLLKKKTDGKKSNEKMIRILPMCSAYWTGRFRLTVLQIS